MTGGEPNLMLAELVVSSPTAAWSRLGFVIESGDVVSLPDLTVRFASTRVNGDDPVISWTFVDHRLGRDDPPHRVLIDGLLTELVPERTSVRTQPSPLGVVGVDHVVVMTGNLERTCGAITEVTGAVLKRVRDAGQGVRQGFHRFGPVILEVVERPDLARQTPAKIWGLVLTVADIDQAVSWLGPDAVGAPRAAVQAGRRIASIKSDVGLGVAVALMTPAPPR